MTNNRFIPAKNKLGWNVVVFFVCEMIHLVYVVPWVVRAVHTFDCTLVINETPNNVKQWKDHAVIKTHVLTGLNSFPPTVVSSFKGLYPRWANQVYSLEQDTVHGASPHTNFLLILVNLLRWHASICNWFQPINFMKRDTTFPCNWCFDYLHSERQVSSNEI